MTSLPVDYVSFITAFAVSALTQYLVRDFLHGYSNHNELWIGIFLALSIYLIIVLQARAYLYSQKTKRSLYWRWRQDFMQFLYQVVLFVTANLFFETVVYLMHVTPMSYNDYLNFANFGVFFVFVFVRKFQMVLTPAVVLEAQKRAEEGERLARQQEDGAMRRTTTTVTT